MVGRNPVGFEKDEVLIVLGYLKVALYKVGELCLLLGVARRQHSYNERMSRAKVLLDLFYCKVTASEHLGAARLCLCLPVCILDLFLFIDRLQFVELLLGGEAGVSLALADELLCKGLIYGTSLALLIGSVRALVGDISVLVKYCALVEVDSVFCKGLDKSLCRALDLTLRIRILDSKVENTARLMRKSLADG